jgi:hypothetical protein
MVNLGQTAYDDYVHCTKKGCYGKPPEVRRVVRYIIKKANVAQYRLQHLKEKEIVVYYCAHCNNQLPENQIATNAKVVGIDE